MNTHSESEAIFFSILLVACAVGIVYGVYLIATSQQKVEGLFLAGVSAIIALILL